MTVRRVECLVFVVLLLLFANAAFPETPSMTSMGRIVGDVCGDDGKSLDFVNIVVLGTTMGAMTRNGGWFEIQNVPAGTYTLRASFVGYDAKSLPVVVAANHTSQVSFCTPLDSLAPSPIRPPPPIPLPPPQCGELRLVDPTGTAVERFPLRHTRVHASVAGSATHVVVEQTFTNPYRRAIEAVYVFPLPHRAAVDFMQIQIGERVIRAVIRKRQEAKQVYEQARAEGRVAALLEQERPNIFTQQVANLMPGQEIVVSIRYFEELQWEGEYELVIPTVIGPRFIPRRPLRNPVLPVAAHPVAQEGTMPVWHRQPVVRQRNGTGWAPDTDRVPDASRVTPPVLSPDIDGGHDIDIEVDLDAGAPIASIESVNHEVEVSREGDTRAHVQTRAADRIPNKDFVLRYRIASDRLRFGVLAHRDESSDSGYFTLLMRPPATSPERDLQPLDLVLVLDVSGSMQGAPLEAEKGLVRWILKRLRPEDRLSMIEFSNLPRRGLPEEQPCTPANVEAAIRHLETLRAGGGTNMLEAVQMALDLGVDSERLRVICLLTDGFVGNEREIHNEVSTRQVQARLFAIGIGNSPNRYLVDGLAEAGLGAQDFLGLDESPRAVADRFFERIESPVLSDITFDWKGLQVRDVQPQPLPPLFANRPVQVTGRYVAGGNREIVIHGKCGSERFEQRLRVRLPSTKKEHEALRVLWARQRIHDLERPPRSDDSAAAREVEQLGLQHELLTRFTAFVATDNQVVSEDGMPTLVPQPVEMPQGVRHEGVFGVGGGYRGLGLRKGVAGVVQTITITSEARKVDVKASATPHMAESGSVAPMAIEGVKEAVALDAEVVVRGGEFHVRGGRSAVVRVPVDAVPETRQAPKTEAPTLRFELERKHIRPGQPVVLRIFIENTTNRPVQVPSMLELGDGVLQVGVRFADAPLPPPKHRHEASMGSVMLQPGESRSYSVRLDGVDAFVFQQRGTYEIEVKAVGKFAIDGVDGKELVVE